jgi:phytoene synthase
MPEGLDPQQVLSVTEATPELRRMVKKLLSEAHALYVRSEAGVAALPLNARTGIYAARYIYDAIGQAVARNHYDSITHRGRTTKAQKMALLAKSSLRTAAGLVMPRSPVLYARPLAGGSVFS